MIKKQLFKLTFLLIILAISCSYIVAEESNPEQQQLLDDEIFKQFSMFADVFTRIEKDYVDDVENKELFYGAIKGMLRNLDPYSQFYDPQKYERFTTDNRGIFGGLGIFIGIRNKRLTVISPIEDTPADKAGILAGDIIAEIEGESTVDMSIDDAVTLLRGEPETQVTITIIRKGVEEPFEVTITRDIIKIQSVKHAIINDNIGYIKISQFLKNTGEFVDKAFYEFSQNDIKGIILDLRNNPGGLLTSAVEVASDFLEPDKLVVYTKGRKEPEEFKVIQGKTQKQYPLVVLVNQGSASGSEIVAGAIKDHKRGIIMGARTFGKASVQKVFELSDGSAVKLTIAHYYTPNGTYISKIGITPDIELPQFTPAERKMFIKLRDNEKFDTFIENAEDNVLNKLKDAENNRDYDKPNELLSKYNDLINELEKDEIVLSNDLIKYAIALETDDKIDDYEYDRHIMFAAKYLQTFDILQ